MVKFLKNFLNVQKRPVWNFIGDFIKIFTFETILKCKALIFRKIFEDLSNFWQIFFEKKLGPIE